MRRYVFGVVSIFMRMRVSSAPSDGVERLSFEISNRPEEFRDDDVVVGEFLGDTELLIYSPSCEGAARVSVALPLAPRRDWYAIGPSLSEVFEKMMVLGGRKYWEER